MKRTEASTPDPQQLFEAPTQRARRLRRDQTEAERRLWQRLRGGKLGTKFRRQHPLGGYILDFCCLSHLLVVELDGAQHGDPEATVRDLNRDHALQRLGFRVVRFTNHQVLREMESVLEAIGQLLSPSRCLCHR